ncbi:unnamed protein product, partial [Ectocarpus sp. 8 AP-2014]
PLETQPGWWCSWLLEERGLAPWQPFDFRFQNSRRSRSNSERCVIRCAQVQQRDDESAPRPTSPNRHTRVPGYAAASTFGLWPCWVLGVGCWMGEGRVLIDNGG